MTQGDGQATLAEIRACRRCAPDLPLGPRPVLQFHPDAKILIAGQAPGQKVHQTGTPFDDPSGVRLRAWLGLTEAQFYNPLLLAILPMGFCYPGSGKSGDAPPRPECAPQWRVGLLDRLKNLELTLVIGMYAMAWHLGDRRKSTLTDTVKAWQEYWPEGIVPLPHPSPRNNIWLKKNPWFTAEVIPALQGKVAPLALHHQRRGTEN